MIMQKQTVAFSKNASNLFFHILTRCNLSCTHCYINRKQHGDTTLSIQTIKDWLGLFTRQNAPSNVIFLGGEPTLHPDLSLAVFTAREMGYKSITIDTNGYLFHNILDRISGDDIDYLSFSLDGATAENNDRIRGRGSFDRVLSGIRQAVEKSFACSMIYTVSAHNIHELERMPSLVKSLGIRRFFIQVVGLRGASSSENTRQIQVSRDIWLKIIPEVAREMAGCGIIVSYPKVYLEPSESFECAGNVARNFFVFPNGRVYQCPICEDYPLHSFEIRNNSLVRTPSINEQDLFRLSIPEGCVMNKLIQPENLSYTHDGSPAYQVACCLLKEEVSAP
jgi:MoaA/NifB/PqqE/SkfB family radical SAM enzyme